MIHWFKILLVEIISLLITICILRYNLAKIYESMSIKLIVIVFVLT